jgi:thiamine-monophosphate kinase
LSTLRDIGEDALIARLVKLAPRDPDPLAGPGDDCAVIDPGRAFDELLLLKTDAMVADVHFLPETPAEAVGWKAVARVVSDFAAMGGKPKHFLVTLAVAADTPLDWVENLYRGIGRCLQAHDSTLAGGETSRVPPGSAAVISISATGVVTRDHLALRSTAKPGDMLLVTGTLGGSLRSGKHLDFTPRLKEANWLVSKYKPTAMMDVSDGLAKDLPRLAAASGCGFVLNRGMLPLTEGCDVNQALSDGEDFELLLAMSPTRLPALLESWQSAFPELPLIAIGRMVENGQGETLTGGWDHFAGNE